MKDTVLEEYPLSLRDLADKLGKSYESARQMVARGEIKQVWIGGEVRFKEEWLRDYLARQTWDPDKHRKDDKK